MNSIHNPESLPVDDHRALKEGEWVLVRPSNSEARAQIVQTIEDNENTLKKPIVPTAVQEQMYNYHAGTDIGETVKALNNIRIAALKTVRSTIAKLMPKK